MAPLWKALLCFVPCKRQQGEILCKKATWLANNTDINFSSMACKHDLRNAVLGLSGGVLHGDRPGLEISLNVRPWSFSYLFRKMKSIVMCCDPTGTQFAFWWLGDLKRHFLQCTRIFRTVLGGYYSYRSRVRRMCRVKTAEKTSKVTPSRKDALQLGAIKKALPEEGLLFSLKLRP